MGNEEGEIFSYIIPEGGGHFMGAAFGDAMVSNQSQAPPMKDIIGTLRWRTQQATNQH